ncbi:NtaA/DmoA family FMN-dependent monooxygenase [Nocardioides nitrophenolicus]|uniref:NtaA/DmoA family FMN-dependent monooxygenase n=1 Tax=Nocardioides nitrophenolicus TaxID=60489 RepID=UPI00195F20F2|nr:NtaA/DmoA family FMN-dependent monooxygenase [Nocardioides nitrophenolicus]MBM7517544.1 FMN-dependent oxidoreductase (nitrilotriacetate monooxygenase family) [Nocardioides nitrophenolicus]
MALPPTRHLVLAASITGAGTSPYAATWPGTRPYRFAEWEHYRHAAEVARRGVLDAVFVSDMPAHTGHRERGAGQVLDPIASFSAIAAAVPDIGFVLTASTSYNSPYNLARRIATLELISGGRTILNLVTNFNPAVAANFGSAALLPRAERYRRAAEFVDVLEQLWDSWQLPEEPRDDGLLWGEETGNPIHHDGEFFHVAGPLNVPSGPQGRPVLSQAGASGPGLDFAAAHAEMVYAATLSKELAVRFRADLASRVRAAGREPADVRVVPGVNIILGDTEAEARRRHEACFGAADEDQLIERFLAAQRDWSQPGLPARIDYDAPLDPAWLEPDPEQNKPIGFSRALQELVAAEGLTPRQVVRRYGEPGGHRLLVGTPRQVADALLDWWSDGVVDGYVAHFPVLPEDLERFVDQVVPILQAEGAFPRSYAESGRTVRERLGLPDPRSSRTAPPTTATEELHVAHGR